MDLETLRERNGISVLPPIVVGRSRSPQPSRFSGEEDGYTDVSSMKSQYVHRRDEEVLSKPRVVTVGGDSRRTIGKYPAVAAVALSDYTVELNDILRAEIGPPGPVSRPILLHAPAVSTEAPRGPLDEYDSVLRWPRMVSEVQLTPKATNTSSPRQSSRHLEEPGSFVLSPGFEGAITTSMRSTDTVKTGSLSLSPPDRHRQRKQFTVHSMAGSMPQHQHHQSSSLISSKEANPPSHIMAESVADSSEETLATKVAKFLKSVASVRATAAVSGSSSLYEIVTSLSDELRDPALRRAVLTGLCRTQHHATPPFPRAPPTVVVPQADVRKAAYEAERKHAEDVHRRKKLEDSVKQQAKLKLYQDSAVRMKKATAQPPAVEAAPLRRARQWLTILVLRSFSSVAMVRLDSIIADHEVRKERLRATLLLQRKFFPLVMMVRGKRLFKAALCVQRVMVAAARLNRARRARERASDVLKEFLRDLRGTQKYISGVGSFFTRVRNAQRLVRAHLSRRNMQLAIMFIQWYNEERISVLQQAQMHLRNIRAKTVGALPEKKKGVPNKWRGIVGQPLDFDDDPQIYAQLAASGAHLLPDREFRALLVAKGIRIPQTAWVPTVVKRRILFKELMVRSRKYARDKEVYLAKEVERMSRRQQLKRSASRGLLDPSSPKIKESSVPLEAPVWSLLLSQARIHELVQNAVMEMKYDSEEGHSREGSADADLVPRMTWMVTDMGGGKLTGKGLKALCSDPTGM